MERTLPQPLHAEVRDANGCWAAVTLIAYAGQDRWQALDADGRPVTVEGKRILSLEGIAS